MDSSQYNSDLFLLLSLGCMLGTMEEGGFSQPFLVSIREVIVAAIPGAVWWPISEDSLGSSCHIICKSISRDLVSPEWCDVTQLYPFSDVVLLWGEGGWGTTCVHGGYRGGGDGFSIPPPFPPHTCAPHTFRLPHTPHPQKTESGYWSQVTIMQTDCHTAFL